MGWPRGVEGGGREWGGDGFFFYLFFLRGGVWGCGVGVADELKNDNDDDDGCCCGRVGCCCCIRGLTVYMFRVTGLT